MSIPTLYFFIALSFFFVGILITYSKQMVVKLVFILLFIIAGLSLIFGSNVTILPIGWLLVAMLAGLLPGFGIGSLLESYDDMMSRRSWK